MEKWSNKAENKHPVEWWSSQTDVDHWNLALFFSVASIEKRNGQPENSKQNIWEKLKYHNENIARTHTQRDRKRTRAHSLELRWARTAHTKKRQQKNALEVEFETTLRQFCLFWMMKKLCWRFKHSQTHSFSNEKENQTKIYFVFLHLLRIGSQFWTREKRWQWHRQRQMHAAQNWAHNPLIALESICKFHGELFDSIFLCHSLSVLFKWSDLMHSQLCLN